MAMTIPQPTPFDEDIWREELEDFVPDRVIDAHTHIWHDAFAGSHANPDAVLRMHVTLADLFDWSRKIFPGRRIGLVALPTPLAGIDYDGHNEWVAKEIESYSSSDTLLMLEGGMLVRPGLTPDAVRDHVNAHHIRILKPYRVYAEHPDTARIADFFPESIMEVADALGLIVVLHLSRLSGPSDEENLRDLKRYTRSYPRIRWILAHCARAFNPVHLERVVRTYARMDSVWMDTSAVTDAYAQYLLLRYFDRSRIVFGSDSIAPGSFRGTYVSFGRGWKAFTPAEVLGYCDDRCTFAVYEQLRSMRQATVMADAGRKDLDDVFYGNAKRLFS